MKRRAGSFSNVARAMSTRENAAYVGILVVAIVVVAVTRDGAWAHSGGVGLSGSSAGMLVAHAWAARRRLKTKASSGG
jgi:hypothetical protein